MARCRECGNLVPPSRGRPRKFCSKKCRTKNQNRRWRKVITEYNRNKRGGVYKGRCKNCGVKVRICDNYCSKKECQRAYLREYMRNRYHSDEAFRKRMIASSIRYNKTHKQEIKEKTTNLRKQYMSEHRVRNSSSLIRKLSCPRCNSPTIPIYSRDSKKAFRLCEQCNKNFQMQVVPCKCCGRLEKKLVRVAKIQFPRRGRPLKEVNDGPTIGGDTQGIRS